MNRITREHYPASKLPEDLRAGVDPTSTVTVTIVEEERRPEEVMSLDEHTDEFLAEERIAGQPLRGPQSDQRRTVRNSQES